MARRKLVFGAAFLFLALTVSGTVLQCYCDRCLATNYTCWTNARKGACMLTRETTLSGEEKKIRRCVAPTHRKMLKNICSRTGNSSRVSQCCWKNFCNDVNLTLPTHKPTGSYFSGTPLTCKCDKCRSTNGTCVTNTRVGACFILLWREGPNNELKKVRRCAMGRPGQSLKQMCRNRKHLHAVRHCCTENMCNADSDIQVPSREPVTPQLLTLMPVGRILTCHCDSCRPTNYTCNTTHACITNALRQQDGRIKKRRGCSYHSTAVMQNLECGSNEKFELNYRVRCCYTNLCNTYDLVSFHTTQPQNNNLGVTPTPGMGGLQRRHVLIIVPAVVVPLLLLGAAVFWFKHFSSKRGGGVTATGRGTSEANEMACISVGSGAGGMKVMEQQTVMKMVTLYEEIGRGRFGRVVRGYCRGEEVAVKISATHHESWNKEVEIFKKVARSYHPNILGLVAADLVDTGETIERYIITHYHAQGCLQDFLMMGTLTTTAAVKMAFTVASGLEHLHCDIVGALDTGKLAIAHRDLKTRNILVKNDGTCCIADFGLAVCRDTPVNHTLVGTRRYLPPEFLDDSYDRTDCFTAYKERDVYAMGLVFWEIAQRCCLSDEIPTFEYQLPFYDKVPSDPSLEEMRIVVSDECTRPKIPESLMENEVMRAVVGVMRACWNHCSKARLTALRSKKTLRALMSKQSLTTV